MLLFRFLFVVCFFFCNTLFAAPAFVSVQDRIQEADLVLAVQVNEVKLSSFNKSSQSAHLNISTIESLKGENPGDFHLAFLVFPEAVENHLRQPVPKGKYIVFLKKKYIGKNKKNMVLVLLKPRSFAFIDYKKSVYNDIKNLIKN